MDRVISNFVKSLTELIPNGIISVALINSSEQAPFYTYQESKKITNDFYQFSNYINEALLVSGFSEIRDFFILSLEEIELVFIPSNSINCWLFLDKDKVPLGLITNVLKQEIKNYLNQLENFQTAQVVSNNTIAGESTYKRSII